MIYNERETVKQDLTICSRREEEEEEMNIQLGKTWIRVPTIEPSSYSFLVTMMKMNTGRRTRLSPIRVLLIFLLLASVRKIRSIDT